MKTHKPKRRFGVILVIIGVICLAAAAFLIVYNIVNGLRAESFSRTVVSEIEDYIAENETEQQNETTPTKTEQNIVSDRIFEGYSYIGYLTIPDLSLKLPVMSDWSYEGLNLSPCRYSGSGYSLAVRAILSYCVLSILHDLIRMRNQICRLIAQLTVYNIG